MSQGADQQVIERIEDGVGHLTLNRPAALNAFSIELAEQFTAAIERFAGADAVRVIVLRGAGRIFSAGGDVRAMWEAVRGTGDRAGYFRDPLAAFNRMVLSIRKIPKPVVAAVHGAVAGVAFNLVLACDLRIAAAGTRFAQAFVKLGLTPDGGGTWFLPRLVGYARACELAMLPTEIDAATAQTWGLVNRVVAPEALDEEVKKLAAQLARGPAGAIGRAKALFDHSLERTLAEQLEAERAAQVENAASPDFAEGLQAFLEKREPKFG